MEKYLTTFSDQIIAYTPKIIGAIVILVLGLWAIRIVRMVLRKLMESRKVDISVSKFIQDLVKWGLQIMLFIVVISKLDIPTTSFIAVIGAAGLAVGMALQGSLANFAGGVLIIIFKPFKVGDYVKAQGIFGTVEEITIFTTKLSTDNNQMAIIPNGKLSNDNVINYSVHEHRKEMMDIGIGYDDDIKKAKEVLLDLAMKHPKTVKDGEGRPGPKVVVKELGDSSVILQLQYWTKTGDFWATRWFMLEEIKNTLDKEGINIPYPQQDIYIKDMPNKANA